MVNNDAEAAQQQSVEKKENAFNKQHTLMLLFKY